MPAPDLKYTPGVLPERYLAVPISTAEERAALRVCVLVRQEPDPVAGRLVVLRDHLDAKVYLGAVVDQGERVQQWVEIWVQSPEGVAEGIPAARETLSNKALDQRWEAQVKALDRIERPLVIKTGAELAGKSLGEVGGSGRPVWIDHTKREPVHPVDAQSGKSWMLCRDDAALLKAGLPAYSSSLHRYLYVAEAGDAGAFVPVTKGAPTNVKTTTLKVDGLTPLNPGGGLILVRTFSPVKYENYADMLGGGPIVGVWHGASTVDLDAAHKKPTSGIWSAGAVGGLQEGGLFLGQQGKFGRLIESLHLKLRALADVLAGVRSFAQETQRPLLNLRPESVQVRLGEPAPGLPHLWTSRVVLADAGDAVALPIQTSDAVYYVPALGGGGSSIYRPESAGSGGAAGSVRGKGSLRIRQLLTQPSEEVILEATLTTDEKLRAGPNDLVWLRVNLASGRCDLFGRLESQSALGGSAGGEFRFRSLPQKLAGDTKKHLAAAEGVPIPDVPLEVIPLLSTPCDLYSLAVMGVRTMLVNPQTTLAVALDELLSLARHASGMGEGAGTLESRIEAVLSGESGQKWIAALGPQRLTTEQMTPAEALNVVPLSLWANVLAMLVRMFPASVVGSTANESACRDLGDARHGGLHLVFDRATSDMDTLLRKTRSLIVIDWNYNREVHAVIRRYMTGVKGGEKVMAGAR